MKASTLVGLALSLSLAGGCAVPDRSGSSGREPIGSPLDGLPGALPGEARLLGARDGGGARAVAPVDPERDPGDVPVDAERARADIVHRVEPGDTLGSVARRYDDDEARWRDIGPGRRPPPGIPVAV